MFLVRAWGTQRDSVSVVETYPEAVDIAALLQGNRFFTRVEIHECSMISVWEDSNHAV
jgi:predicted nuclease with RNAse H fold